MTPRTSPAVPFGFGQSYTKFAFSDLRVRQSGTGGVSDVDVSATITNVGHTAGADVAQLYLGDPAQGEEPPRQLVGFDKIALNPGQSARIHFTITPRDTWWWDEAAQGWTQSPGTYQVYVGDSSALADLTLRGSFAVAQTPAARQVMITAPSTLHLGRGSRVTVSLTRSGNELARVQLALQVPQGWTVQPLGPTVFTDVGPAQAPGPRSS